ncbi:hypothetical protein HZC00_01305 [Candidatus Kaiserbacteria bacterium]|nr:hypothetical protein [Candidatus Kaiserbacteria bacterium]
MRGKHYLPILIAMAIITFASSVHADTPCNVPDPVTYGSFFTPYEADEYQQGLLTQHFQNQTEYPGYPPFKIRWSFFDDECQFANQLIFVTPVSFPLDITDWSIRFTSSTHFDVWDDEHETILTSQDIDQYPPYTRIEFTPLLGDNISTQSYLRSRTLKIQEDGHTPILTGTLPKDPACPSMSVYGNIFDPAYEHAEYIDGLLRVHVRFTTMTSSGGFIRTKTLSVPASCDRDSQIPPTSWKGVTPPPRMKYFSFRMTSPTHWVMWNDEADTPVYCDMSRTDPYADFDRGCEGDLEPSASYTSFYMDIGSGSVATLITTPFPPVERGCTENCNSNVLFLPGIEASRLYRPQVVGDPDKQLWEPGNNIDVQELYLNPDGSSVRPDVYTKEGDVIDEKVFPVLGGNIYKSFIDRMNTLESDGKINDWEAASYDWRLSLDDILQYGHQVDDRIYYSGDSRATTTPYIIQELRRLATTSRTGKVTIIAHSNGGLVGKALTEALGPEAPQLIDRIIFIAVPQAGTPMALPADLHGYKQAYLGGLVLSQHTARTFAQHAPMAYNLLPSAPYFTYVDDPVVSFDPRLTDWITRYGSVIHSAPSLHTFLTDTYGRVDPQTGDINTPIQMSDTLLTVAENTHTELDSWTPPTGVQLVQIAGWGVPTTVSGITYKPHGAGVTYEADTTIDGDGTVVVPSALWTSTETGAVNYWVDLKDYNKLLNRVTNLRLKTDHSNILEVSPLLDLISSIIQHSTSTVTQYISTTNPVAEITDHQLHFALHSPLTLDMYDDQGRHTGVSTTTGEVEEQIPGTYYAQFGETKHIFSDATTTMHIMMEGYDTGTFTFNVDELEGDTRIASTTFQDIPTTENTTVTLDIQSDITTLSSMSIDVNSDGAVDHMLVPKLDGIVTLDTTPPEIQITFATSTNALRFIGIDDMGTTTVSATMTYPVLKKHQREARGIATTTVTVRDLAGNTTVLVYTEKLPSPEKRDTISLEEIAYNGATTTLSDTSVSYKWRTDKNGLYKLFAAHIKTNATSTESHYRPKKDQTVVMTKPHDLDDTDEDDDVDSRSVKQRLPGMIIPYLRTEEGRVIIGY